MILIRYSLAFLTTVVVTLSATLLATHLAVGLVAQTNLVCVQTLPACCL